MGVDPPILVFDDSLMVVLYRNPLRLKASIRTNSLYIEGNWLNFMQLKRVQRCVLLNWSYAEIRGIIKNTRNTGCILRQKDWLKMKS